MHDKMEITLNLIKESICAMLLLVKKHFNGILVKLFIPK